MKKTGAKLVVECLEALGVDFGHVDLIEFAKVFGATGFKLTDPADFSKVCAEAEKIKGPVLVDVPIDYSNNPELFISVDERNVA